MNQCKQVFCLFFLAVLIFVPSCRKAPTPVEPSPVQSMVTAHTSGVISRESPIRVRFADDIVTTDQVNLALENSPFVFTPAIRGIALWSDSRTLEFRPDQRLDGGVEFNAEVKLTDFMETESGAEVFRFDFSAMRQSFEISIEGLQSIQGQAPQEQKLSGTLVTADVENASDIERIIKTSQPGRELSVEWTHAENRREHGFIIQGIVRGENPTELVVEWDGDPIGVDKKGERTIAVPSLSTFSVLQARVVQDQEQYVEVRFSDSLQPRQDLRGLINLDSGNNLRFTIEDNIVRIYSTSPWAGAVTITVNPGVRNSRGSRLSQGKVMEVMFQEILPQVRFTGKGVIIPTSQGLTIPIETINLRAVVVEATRIHEDNIPQFLQVNDLEEDSELNRVGRPVWKKTVSLNYTPDKKNQWIRYGLDISPLIQAGPGELYRIHLSFRRSHIVYRCADGPGEADTQSEGDELESWDSEQESSYWDNWEGNFNWRDYYNNRHNPCHPAYYRSYYDHDINVFRNVMVSDLGLLAKRGNDGSIFAVVTDIKTSQPLPGAELTLLDYQQQILDIAHTDENGTARFSSDRTPFLLMAKHGSHSGYLKLDDGAALSVSHFDVSGTQVSKGLKGYLYGERGVWRPGDSLFLTFILLDSSGRLPDDHPVTFELRNPRGQLVKTISRRQSINGFYSFAVDTDPEAPTGSWNARVMAGGAVFEKNLRIETVMPNRLKIKVDFGGDVKSLAGGQIDGELSASWLHGATARNLKTDIELTLTSARTRFPGYDDFVFEDPVREFSPESHKVFDGTLDASGKSRFSSRIRVENVSPGMLSARFMTRVFEPGGAFSIDQVSIPYHPYERYIGIRTPKGDKARGMLLTDTKHPLNIVALDKEGNLLKEGRIKIEMYKIKWQWWWEKGRESLADYLGTENYRPIQSAEVELKDGTGMWEFEVKYPDWGRYLIRAVDQNGKHITGKILYIDWPGWAGRAQKDMPGGATVLSFASDKSEYSVGETVVLTIPTGRQGRGLVSLETGSRVLRADWIDTGEEAARFEFTTTEEMTPNIYAHVTLLQPHLQAGNDLPIRMYGVIPIRVVDPQTRISPIIKAPEVFIPEETARISVREEAGKPMTYTIAIVDEGLLDLTRFATPDPWNHFYQREALGVKTWDLFDRIAGAFGGKLEQLLAIGGDDEAGPEGAKKATRFPPMVKFLGPFELEQGKETSHDIPIPQYVGSVRIMVVAGQGRAFGHSEQTAFVRKPLMILGTLPRVLSPEEEVDVPVAVFALEDKVKEVSLAIETKGPVEVAGSAEQSITFTEPGESLISFRVKTGDHTGTASILLSASGGGERAAHQIELDVRSPAAMIIEVVDSAIPAAGDWREEVTLPGIPGTNQALLEVSRIPPLDLDRRLDFLIRYPHGCVEQLTSAVFPQLYLNKLLELSRERQDEIQRNITAGIERLRLFQDSSGGFLYWPGGEDVNSWASNYAGHFLVEAEGLGYAIPSGILGQWKKFQRGKALAWVKTERNSDLIQAYRLYTLALAGAPEIGAMNRLREIQDISPAARWRLAAAYQLAGQTEAAQAVIKNATMDIPVYRELSHSFGSTLRDKAMILEALGLLNQSEKAFPLIKEISDELSKDQWMSTQTTAFALIAMARTVDAGTDEMRFTYLWTGGRETPMTSKLPVVQLPLPVDGLTGGTIFIGNSQDSLLYARLVLRGMPKPGSERAAENGMVLRVRYLSLDNQPLNPDQLEQGTDFIAQVTVSNTGVRGEYREIALSHLVPSGWEIRNIRMAPTGLIKNSPSSYQDIRDDRVYTYFHLKQGETRTFSLLLNATYLGRFYLPMINVEAMYDAAINARVPGRWISVIKPGEARSGTR